MMKANKKLCKKSERERELLNLGGVLIDRIRELIIIKKQLTDCLVKTTNQSVERFIRVKEIISKTKKIKTIVIGSNFTTEEVQQALEYKMKNMRSGIPIDKATQAIYKDILRVLLGMSAPNSEELIPEK